MRRKRRPVLNSPVWECSVCLRQFVDGPRCGAHNPSPEARAADPERYPRDQFVKHIRDTPRREVPD